MEPLRTHLRDDLRWTQPEVAHRTFQLRAGDDVLVAILRFHHRFGSLATGQTRSGLWCFERTGALNRYAVARIKGTRKQLAVYNSRWGSREGPIQLYDGRIFELQAANFWATNYRITYPSGETLIEYRAGIPAHSLEDLFKVQARVHITQVGRAVKMLELLIVTGWYLMVVEKQEFAVIAATVAATASARR